MNSGINLLDYKNKIQPKHENNKQRPLRLIAVSLLFIVSVSSVIFFLLVALSPLPQLRKQEKIASFNLTLVHPDIVKLMLVKERTDNIQKLIDSRPYYDKFLNSIQTKLPPGVIIDAVSIDKSNFLITLSSNSLLQLDNFLNELNKSNDSRKEYSKAAITNLSTGDNGNAFHLTVSLNTL